MPLRLLHVTQPTVTGVARVVADLAGAQASDGHDVHVACPTDGTLGAELTSSGHRLHDWAAATGPGPGTAGEVRRLARIVHELRPDLVHLHSSKAGLAGRLALRGSVPTVFQPHAWSFDAVTGLVRAGALGWERAATRWTSLLLCVSQAERERGASHGIAPARIAVVPNGVDLDRLTPASPDARRSARAALGRSDVPLAVCIGRLAPQKGQDLLLAAWPGVQATVPDAQLVLVGDGPDRDRLRITAGPRVDLVGASDRIADWLAAADVVVVPSRWEGMALVPLEAMARGRSVVASDVTGMRESLPEQAGALIPPGDKSALAAALAARLSGEVDADGEGRLGRRHVERHHDLRRVLAQMTAEYAQVLP